MNVTPIIIPTGITAGTPFTQGSLVYVSATTPSPVLSSYTARRSTDAVSAVVYTDFPDNAGTYVTTTNLNETVRIKGGAVIEGSGSNSVQIGPGAAASATDSIAIGRVATADAAEVVVIGATATNTVGTSQGGVIVGFGGSMNNAAGVVIGHSASVVGNGGGTSSVAIGSSATANTASAAGASGAIAIGMNADASEDCVVIGANATSNVNSASGVGSVVIGTSATSNKAVGFNVAIGYTANVTQTNAIAIGSGATVTAAAAQTYSIAIGAGTTITGTQSITIGGGGANIGDNTMQLGAPSTQIVTWVLGAGNTIASPAAKTIRFTNATGTDNAAGNVTFTAPLSTGNATPATLIFQVGVQVAGSSSTLQTAGNGLVLSHTTVGGHLATFGNTVTITNATANTSVLTSTGYSLTGSSAVAMVSLAGTWNTSGTPTALSLAITNTASNAASLLMNLLAGAGGATSVFAVRVDGLVTTGSGVFTGGDVRLPASNDLYWNTRSLIESPANGQLNLSNNAITAGVGFDFSTDAILLLRTRAQTGYATLDVLGLRASGAAGASFGPGLPTSLTFVNGICTAAS